MTAAALTAAVPAARAATPAQPAPPSPASAAGAGTLSSTPTTPVSPGRALTLLQAGNARYAALRQAHPHLDAARRKEVATAQHPFAVVLGCLDSRVPPELVFDQGLGDLMTVRTAGQALDDAVLGSIQYAVQVKHIKLVVVLGHERCGAAEAAVEYVRTGIPAEGPLAEIVEQMAPAAREARHLPGDWVENTVRANVARVQEELASDSTFDGALVVGARFDLDTGHVTFEPSSHHRRA
ncbi:carbonic anhydrase [Streptomyces purpureus]|uniref:Carbonic anhydrase n=2 Tax=Streptomyces purpureus TaxID=1951 RepID=A0A918GWE1_9ACTN|nr:carbonic anhydrase [Streptomyces purpureus]